MLNFPDSTTQNLGEIAKIDKLKDSCLFFGLDHLELYLSDYEGFRDDFGNFLDFSGLDEDNTPSYNISVNAVPITVTLTHPKGFKFAYQFIVSVENKPVPLFMIRFPENIEKSKVSLVIYSSFFVLEEYIGINLYDFIQERFSIHGSRRIDIAFDTTLPIDYLLNHIFKDTIFHSGIGKDKKNIGFHQTYYIGELRSDKNRKYVIRIYDKLEDTFKKNKGFLYSHLDNTKNVRRIELEIRPHEAARIGFSFSDIIKNKNNAVEHLFCEYLNKHWSIHFPVEVPLKPYRFKPFDLRGFWQKNGFIPQDYSGRVRGYFKKVIENTGYDGLSQIMSTTELDKEGKPYNMNHTEALKYLDSYISYLKKSGTRKSLLKKILKSHL